MNLFKFKKDVLVVILTTSDTERLQRCYFSLKDAYKNISCDIDIMINTLDKDYPYKVKEMLKKEPVSIYESESNGTPARGGNCVLEHFRNHKKRYDYLMIVDGDDFFYPCAFEQIEKILEYKPDVVGLQALDALVKRELNPKNENFHNIINDVYLNSWYDKELNLNLHFPKDVHSPVSKQFPPDRISFLSKRFLKTGKVLFYPENFKIFSDYSFSIHCYSKALNENYSYVHTSNSYIYIYDRTNEKAITKNRDESFNHINKAFYESIQEPLKHCDGNIDFRIIPFFVLDPPSNYNTEKKIDFIRKNFIN